MTPSRSSVPDRILVGRGERWRQRRHVHAGRLDGRRGHAGRRRCSAMGPGSRRPVSPPRGARPGRATASCAGTAPGSVGTPGRGRSRPAVGPREPEGTAAWFVAWTIAASSKRRRERRPAEQVPRRIERAERPRHDDRRPREEPHLRRIVSPGRAERRDVERWILGGERREELPHVGPDPAGSVEPQLVDVERDLHLEASTHRHPPGPTVAACPVPGSRSSRSPSLSSRSPSSVWNTIEPARAEQHLVVAVVVPPVRVAGVVAPRLGRGASLDDERRGRIGERGVTRCLRRSHQIASSPESERCAILRALSNCDSSTHTRISRPSGRTAP